MLKRYLKRSWLGDLLLLLYRYFKPEQKFSNRIKKDLNQIILRDNNNAVFFGYHDKTPFNHDGSKILALSYNGDAKDHNSECKNISIGYFNSNHDESYSNPFNYVTYTDLWCWQQGAMLQWYPKMPNQQIVFNKLLDNEYGSVIFDIDKKQVIKEMACPIYAISPDGNNIASLNFSRLGRLRPGYGYNVKPDLTNGIDVPKNDGLFIYNIKTGNKKLVVDYETLAFEVNGVCYDHYINHATYSPGGINIVFFHIWFDENKNKRMRMLVYNVRERKLKKLENEKVISHYCWFNDNEILCTVNDSNHKGWSYCIYNVFREKYIEPLPVKLFTDGHPMVHPANGNVILTDSRVDSRRTDSVLLFKTSQEKYYSIKDYVMPYSYSGQVRCDLHPRWDRKGKYIVVDTIYKGSRVMARIDGEPCVKLILTSN